MFFKDLIPNVKLINALEKIYAICEAKCADQKTQIHTMNDLINFVDIQNREFDIIEILSKEMFWVPKNYFQYSIHDRKYRDIKIYKLDSISRLGDEVSKLTSTRRKGSKILW